jgi:hypothetical protein
MNFPFGETIQRIRALPALDPYSDEVTGSIWVDAPEVDIIGVGVEPRPSAEPLEDARNSVTSGFTLYMPYDSDVTSADRVRVRGVVYEVEGEPSAWRSPFTGWAPGLVVQAFTKAG